MNGKIWVLGDAVVDLLPDGEGRLLQCPAAHRPTSRSAWRGSAATAGLLAASAYDPFGRFMRHTWRRSRSM